MNYITTTATFSHIKAQGVLFGQPDKIFQYWTSPCGHTFLIDQNVLDTSREITVSYDPNQDMANAVCSLVTAPTLF